MSAPVAPDTVPVDLFAEVVGQPDAVSRLRHAAAAPVHAYLFIGPAGSGKRAAARAFAAALLQAGSRGEEAERHARLALAEQHPDLVVVEPAGARIAVDQVRDVVRLTARSPVEGERKVIVLCEFHRMETYGAMLLKSIEEPPPSTVFVILADELVPDLVTIASRSVQIEFRPVPDDAIRDRLVDEGASGDAAAAAARAANGSIDRARLLVADEGLANRLEAWRSVPERLDGTGQAVATQVDELRDLIDRAQAPLDARHVGEAAAAEEERERYGTSGGRDLETRQRREARRLRTDELRFGLATLAGRYRDELAEARDPVPLMDAIAAITVVTEALVRNPSEALLLQGLFVDLPAL